MLKAIDRCRTSALMKQASRAQGLRCIREFEQINGRTFDPTNEAHLMTVAGMGPYSATFWRVRQLHARHPEWTKPSPTAPRRYTTGSRASPRLAGSTGNGS